MELTSPSSPLSSSPPAAAPPLDGKVLRLHFACRAELPFGSSLRVTSSNFISENNSNSYQSNQDMQDDDLDPNNNSSVSSSSNLYTSSVEMVTSPEMYPLWRTRTPVIRVVNSDAITSEGTAPETNSGSGSGVLLHRYRYLVVSPGDTTTSTKASTSASTKTTASTSGSSNMKRMITSDGNGGVVEVDMFENPFTSKEEESENEEEMKDDTVHSIVLGQPLSPLSSPEKSSPFPISELPFRTLEIDVSSGNSDTFGKVLGDGAADGAPLSFTNDGIRIDTWNDLSDISFQPYHRQIKLEEAEKEAITASSSAPHFVGRRKKNHLNKNSKHHSSISNSSAWTTSESDSDALLSEKKDVDVMVNSSSTSSSILPSKTTSTTAADNETNKMANISTTAVASLASSSPGATTPTSPSPAKRIFLVCYHLPIILKRDNVTGDFTAKFSESLLAKTEQSGVSKSYETGWIGTVSLDLKTDEEKNAVREVLKPLNCMPIFLDKNLRDSFYYGMCKQVLWPAFHNIDLLDISKSGWGNKGISDAPDANNWDQSRLDVWWGAYCEVNQVFSDTLMTIIKPHDKIWVHDYHLSLLPKLLHEAECSSLTGERTVQMVYFLHIPFPTSQVFRELEHGGEILEGMLHADVVGFHAFDHARHFLNAAKRILGLTHESLVGGLIGVRHRGTKVLVTISNVSIETDVVQRALDSPSLPKEIEGIQEKYKERKIIAGVDVAQGLSGISLKLLAYERMLSDYPQWVGNVVLMQRNLIPSVRKADEIDTLNHVRHLVKRLKTNFGPDCINYDEIHGASLPILERLALWSCSDVFMSACIREGLNLLPLEYVYTKSTTPGVTLISEFSAMSSILNGALRVNPYDVKLASTVLEQALSMSVEEKASRRERDIHFVSTSPSGQWTRNVLRDLHDVKLATEVHDKPSKRSLRASAKMEAVTAETTGSLTLLDPNSVTSAYNYCEKRVIFVDFNGTIVMKEPPGKFLKREMLGISGNKPPEETIKALTALCADERNVVFVVSGDTETNIENAIGDIPGLGLAAGNGGSISLPLKPGETSRRWEAIDQGVDWEAVLKITMPILSKYTARANGAFVKHTSSSIGWSYYGCDPEWGEILATHLVVELQAALSSFDIRMVKLKGVLEVVPRKLNKGQIVRRVLKDNGADFILCMGDDISDEKMFSSVFSVVAESNAKVPAQREKPETSHVFTVSVGKKRSNASYYVENAQDVADLLVDISGLRRSLGRAMSWDNEDLAPGLFA